MTTTELIKILQDNEKGAISHKSREISLTINGRYMINPQIKVSGTGDGICGAEIDLDINGKWLEQELNIDMESEEIKNLQKRAYLEGFHEASKMLVKQEPKTGHWIDDKCSVCGKGTEDLIDSREWYQNEDPKYCPFCGVKLESEDT